MTYARDLARLARTGITTVATAQELRDLVFYSGIPPALVQTLGAVDEADGGGGVWRWDPLSTLADNRGICLMPSGSVVAGRWLRIRPDNEVEAAWWGLVTGGVVDCSPAIQEAIDYAESLALPSLAEPGLSIAIPQGLYLINTPLLISRSGIALAGPTGRGAELTGPGTIIQIGNESDWSRRLLGCGIYNLIITATVLNSVASTGVRLWRTNGCDLHNVEIWNFYVGLDCFRASNTWLLGCRIFNTQRTAMGLASIRLQGIDESLQTGETYTPGGGMHITDCEFRGGEGATRHTLYGILVNAVDGLYLTQCHFARFQISLAIKPEGTAANHTIATVLCTNVYFDDPAGNGDAGRNLDIGGVVSNSIVMANGYATSSAYVDLVFVNGYFRAAGIADRCVNISVSDLDTWESSGKTLSTLTFNACEFREPKRTAFVVPATTDIRPGALIISSCYFSKFNSSQVESAYAISARAHVLTVTNNVFANAAPGGLYVILVADPTDSAIVTGNDLSQAHIVSTGQFIRLGITDLVNSVTADNNSLPGAGRIATFDIMASTTDATTLKAALYAVSADNGGTVDAVLVGQGPNSQIVVSKFHGSYRRVGTGNLVLSTGTNDFTAADVWNPDTLPTLPRVGKEALTAGTINMYATGRAGETWTWICRATFVEAT